MAFKEGYRAVTLDGDIYDPKGAVMGGFNENYHRIESFIEFQDIKQRMIEIEKSLQENSVRVDKVAGIEREKKGLLQKKEELEHRKSLLEQEEKAKGEMSFEGQTKRINDALEQETAAIEKMNNSIKENNIELKKLEYNVQIAQNGEGNIREVLRNDLKKAGDEINSLKHELEKTKKEIQKREIQIKKLETDSEKSAKIVEDARSHISELNNELDSNLLKHKESLNANIGEIKKIMNELEAKLIESDIKEKELAESNSQIHSSISEKQAEFSQIESTLKSLASETEEHNKLINVLKSENPFIEVEEKRFGTENSEYDFDNIDIKQLSDQSGKLQKEMEKLKKMININVDEVGDSIEKQYDSLMDKKAIVQKDKERLLKIISELDTKKRDALKEVWTIVNKDFGDIFTTLFPAAKAQLVLINETDITEGIEFQVSFKDIIKKSLTELSGGQRTLLALSYIFALLKFKPAPLYILDEIDAALDISHTQNIGVMIREQFPQSQFLVISLKDGMFNNANVLFKVAFVNGGSKVDRLGLRETPENENNDNVKGKSKKDFIKRKK